MEEEKLSPESRRSFNRFLIVVVIIMIVTGFVALWDNWGGDVVEQTGAGEAKNLALPNGVKVKLLAQSSLQFQKGAAHKLFLDGAADIKTGEEGNTRQISFETSDLTVKSRQAAYSLESGDSGTDLEVASGEVHLLLKPDGSGSLFLEAGESYHHKLQSERQQ
ncbi:MAG: FecR domain-containing protein [Saprospiraceae bacterium]|nr:FecR domain-containing protein [Saprospiraceae bacterium]